jgi:hypothetical protein
MAPTENPMPQSTEHTPLQTGRGRLFEIIWENKIAIWAVAVGGFYLCGFLTLNAYLARFGLVEIEVAGNKYLLAASNYLFFLFCFYLFAGRGIVLGKKWFIENNTRANPKNSMFWSSIIQIESLVGLLFSICFSSAVYTSTAIGAREAIYFYLYLGISFLVSYSLDVFNLDIKYRKFALVVRLFLNLGAVIVFFSSKNADAIIGLFSLYFGMTLYINQVLDKFERHKIDKDVLIFSVFHSIFFICVTASVYGALIFGLVSPKYGGGLPVQVKLALIPEVRPTLGKLLDHDIPEIVEAKLIYSTEKFIFVSAFEQTIRLKAGDVSLMTLTGIQDRPSIVEALAPHTTLEHNNRTQTTTSGSTRKD